MEERLHKLVKHKDGVRLALLLAAVALSACGEEPLYHKGDCRDGAQMDATTLKEIEEYCARHGGVVRRYQVYGEPELHRPVEKPE
jgi:hypothetical protein